MAPGWLTKVVAAAGAAVVACAAVAQPVTITQSQLLDRYEGFWLAECIANWTGLRTEGARINPPFLTDADWGLPFGVGGPLDFVMQTPWGADDDTDIEYVYLHLMHESGTPWLSAERIRAGWRTHINRAIWVSNANARALMERGVTPPATGMSAANFGRLAIDAQLTTEIFGAVCPGDPALALDLSYLPIRTTSVGHASHASQCYVLMHALAPLVPAGASGREKAIWLVQSAREYLPPTSKAADVINVVLNDFLANPDVNNWERTRDLVYQRYHANAGANGFTYFGWTESSVNFATGLIALLYGEGDLRRTIQIGTLSGWDSDNGTATMGGLLGWMNGAAWVRAQFPGQTLSDRYWITRTRDNLPDYLPLESPAEDTFPLMAQRMLEVAKTCVLAGGGSIDTSVSDPVWTLPEQNVPVGARALANPVRRETDASAARWIREQGGWATASSSVAASPPSGRGSSNTAVLADGRESNQRGLDEIWFQDPFYTTQRPAGPEQAWLRVDYSQPIEIRGVRFIEGDRFADLVGDGGFFVDPIVRVREGGVWRTLTERASTLPAADVPFQVFTFVLTQPAMVTAIEVSGVQGGTSRFVTCSELDALRANAAIFVGGPRCTGLDVTNDRALDLADVYSLHDAPTDANADGLGDERDRVLVLSVLRAGERKGLLRD